MGVSRISNSLWNPTFSRRDFAQLSGREGVVLSSTEPNQICSTVVSFLMFLQQLVLVLSDY